MNSAMPLSVSPARLERFLAIDLARGFALLGVALVNVWSIAGGWSSNYALDKAPNALAVGAELLVGVVFSHRAFPLLAFLLGAGFVLAGRASQRSRLRALLVIGGLHGLLLWPGEVLATYALMGLMIMGLVESNGPILKRSFWIAFFVAILFYALYWFAAYFPDPEGSTSRPADPADLAGFTSYAQPSYWLAIKKHFYEYPAYGLTQIFAPDLWVAAIAGIWSARTGQLQAFVRNPMAFRFVVILGIASLFLGTVLELVGALRGGWDAPNGSLRGQTWMAAGYLPTVYGSIVCSLSFWSWVAYRSHAKRSDLSALSPPVLSLPLQLIQATGRSSLSQFIGQSILFALIFHVSFLGLHQQVDRFGATLIGLICFVVLSFGLRTWHQHVSPAGPMETVWRALSAKL
jgi:uncharacterized protein